MQADSWLSSLTESSTKHFSLDAPTRLMDSLGNPQDKIRSIHVAGTNGKGSTCCFISSLLNGLGYSVGQFLSPHLTRVEERCLIDGKVVHSEIFFAAVEQVRNAKLPVSYFEAVFAASCIVFNKLGVDFIVVETGLGGRLDATNTISSPVATVVSSIGLDHQDLLGDSLEKIAWEKAHIAKAGSPMIVATDNPVIESVCEEKGASYFVAKPIEVSAVGYQEKNASLAARVVEKICGELPSNYNSFLSRVRWPGRMELVDNERVLIDGAHNLQGVEEFLNVVGDRALVFGCLAHKDWMQMGELFAGHELYYCDFTHPKALSSKEFCEHFPEAKAISSVLELNDKRIACFGSLYFIGEVRPLFTEKFEVF